MQSFYTGVGAGLLAANEYRPDKHRCLWKSGVTISWGDCAMIPRALVKSSSCFHSSSLDIGHC